ncbi:MAG: DsbA family oxidoreductase [Proteobacteria bacterium]|nr:DsbA family oxidoreductase [Pseudomonadota bacterium]
MSSPAPPVPVRIDFVSDVSCPWCAVGLKALEQAIERMGGQIAPELHFQPFELNPQMPPEGQGTDEHLVQKYGSTPEQLARNREALRERGAAVGFEFKQRDRVYNTFDAHRLLHWAGLEGEAQELALKHALLRAYFTDNLDVSSPEVLVRVAATAGLDGTRARQVLERGEYAAEVRAQQDVYLSRGIHAVPSVILNDQHLIQGGQPVELFERALRQVAGLDGDAASQQ